MVGLAQVWMPSMGNVRGDSGEKLVAVASTKVRFHAIWLGILAPLCLLDQPGAAIALLNKTAADMLAP